MAPCVTVERISRSVRNDSPDEDIFPCDEPVHDHMRNEEVRRATFRYWPGNIAASDEEMAQAGLFYTGVGDKTKCFYCDGGLQHWERDDDPMVEHAKWFPECKYILQKRGVEFVSSISSMFPGLDRPIARPSLSIPPRNIVTTTNTSIIYPAATFISGNDIPPSTPRRSNLEDALRNEHTNSMRQLGYSEDLLRKVVVRRLQMMEMFDNPSEFLDAIQDMQNELDSSQNHEPAPSSTSNQIQQLDRSRKPTVEIRIKEIEDERRCKVCLDNQSECVFTPCGHFCTCMRCASQLTSCPLCRRGISRVTKVNLNNY